MTLQLFQNHHWEQLYKVQLDWPASPNKSRISFLQLDVDCIGIYTQTIVFQLFANCTRMRQATVLPSYRAPRPSCIILKSGVQSYHCPFNENVDKGANSHKLLITFGMSKPEIEPATYKTKAHALPIISSECKQNLLWIS